MSLLLKQWTTGIAGGKSWSAYWKASSKVLFLWTGKFSGNNLLSDIDDTVITVTGKDFATSYIPYTSAATFAVPDNAIYEAADTDSMWFDGVGTPKTVGITELVGTDYQRTIIKYDVLSPYHIRAIMILKAGEVLTADEINILHEDFDLWLFWSGVLNANGVIKANRTLADNFNPTFIENMELWLRSDVGVTVTGSGVSEVLDYSGNDRHATQATDARRPPLVTNEMNGKPVISPIAANQNFLSLASSITMTDFSVIIVWKYNADTATFPLGLSSSTNTYISTRVSAIQVRAIATGHSFTVPSASANQNLIDMVLRSSGSLRAFRNEGESSTGAISNANNFVVDQLFANAATNYGTMKIAELLIYSRQLAANEISSVHEYLKEKYAISY